MAAVEKAGAARAEVSALGLPKCMCANASRSHRECTRPLNHQQSKRNETHSS